MSFFTSAVTALKTIVIVLGAGLCIWGGINLLEGYGNDNPGAKSQAFNKNGDQKDTFKQLALYSQNRDVFGIGNRDVIETSWEMKVSSMIRNSHLLEFDDIGYGNKTIKTKSKLLKAFCGYSFELYGLGNRCQDVYFVKYINPLLSEEEKYHSWSHWEDNIKNDEL